MNQSMDILVSEYRDFENSVTLVFKKRVFEGCIDDFTDEEVIGMLVQRRHISCLFTSLCDTIGPLLPEQKSRAIVEGIVRDEYAEMNHREAYVMELEGLGIPRETLKTIPYTTETLRCGRMLVEYALDCARREEIYALASLRVFAEFLAGEEFLFFFRKLFVNNARRKPEDSVFLRPHIDWDLRGAEEGSDGHADQYLRPINSMLRTAEDLELAREAVIAAAAMRAAFYKQYCSKLRMGRADIEKAARHV